MCTAQKKSSRWDLMPKKRKGRMWKWRDEWKHEQEGSRFRAVISGGVLSGTPRRAARHHFVLGELHHSAPFNLSVHAFICPSIQPAILLSSASELNLAAEEWRDERWTDPRALLRHVHITSRRLLKGSGSLTQQLLSAWITAFSRCCLCAGWLEANSGRCRRWMGVTRSNCSGAPLNKVNTILLWLILVS